MAAKKKAVVIPPIVITMTLPSSGPVVRTGTIVAKRGELAAMHQFEYTDVNDIAAAIHRIVGNLISVEENPPPKIFDSTSPSTATTSPSADTKDQTDTDDNTNTNNDSNTDDVEETDAQDGEDTSNDQEDSDNAEDPDYTDEPDPFTAPPSRRSELAMPNNQRGQLSLL